ncbi:DUF1559 domain-containing protein [Pirellulaceae bacterium SH501]
MRRLHAFRWVLITTVIGSFNIYQASAQVPADPTKAKQTDAPSDGVSTAKPKTLDDIRKSLRSLPTPPTEEELYRAGLGGIPGGMGSEGSGSMGTAMGGPGMSEYGSGGYGAEGAMGSSGSSSAEPTLTPEMQQVAQLIRELQQALGTASTPEEKARIEQELRVVLEGYFTMDIERRVRELDKIQARVSKMEAALRKRLSLQSDWIELQLKQILFQAKGVNVSIPAASGIGSSMSSGFGMPGMGGAMMGGGSGMGGGPEMQTRQMGYDFRFGITRILPRDSMTDLRNTDPFKGYAETTPSKALETDDGEMSDMEKLKLILLAFHMFESRFHHMPSAKMQLTEKHPPHSWRVAILPLIGHADLYREYHFDEPWNSQHNSKLIDRMPSIYKTTFYTPNYTLFKIPVGKNAFDYGDGTQPQMQAFLDGLSNTIAVFRPSEPVIWTKPEDEVITDERLPKLATNELSGPDQLIGLADGSVHFLDPSATPEQLRALFTRDGGEVIDRAILHRQPQPTQR